MITSKDTCEHFLRMEIQNELISPLSLKVLTLSDSSLEHFTRTHFTSLEHILGKLQKARYSLIILDGTNDISRKEQMMIVFRFLEAVAGKEITLREHFLGFVQVLEKLG